MAFVISQLIEDNEFNIELMEAFTAKESSYLTKMLGFAKETKGELYAKVFGSSKPHLTYVHEIVVAHVTLLTTMLYEIDSKEFTKASKNKEVFYRLIYSTISS